MFVAQTSNRRLKQGGEASTPATPRSQNILFGAIGFATFILLFIWDLYLRSDVTGYTTTQSTLVLIGTLISASNLGIATFFVLRSLFSSQQMLCHPGHLLACLSSMIVILRMLLSTYMSSFDELGVSQFTLYGHVRLGITLVVYVGLFAVTVLFWRRRTVWWNSFFCILVAKASTMTFVEWSEVIPSFENEIMLIGILQILSALLVCVVVALDRLAKIGRDRFHYIAIAGIIADYFLSGGFLICNSNQFIE